MTTPHDFDDDPDFDPVDGGEWFHPPDGDTGDDVADTDPSAVQMALLADGSALRLTGPGAGSAVAEGTAAVEAVTARLLSRDEALSGQAPLLLIHRARGTDAFPRVMAGIVAATGGRVPLGAVTPVPRSNAVSSRQWLADCATASVRIADPAGFKLDSAVLPGDPPSARSLGWWPYLGADPMVPADVLDAQREVGANLLLSPGRAVDPADPQNSLDQAFAEADRSLAALQPGERVALNLTLPRAWLTRAVLRDQLLAQLLDQEQFDVWYLRVQWPSSLRATEQPADVALLDGYKRLAQLAADEERILLLPQTGMTGWLQLAFGATGFGSGLPGSDQAFKEPIRGGSGAVAIERYFEPTLVHAVERTVHDTLRRRPGYVPCPCPYCPALHNAAEWRPDLAQLHQLHWTGRLTGDAATSSRGGAGGAVRRAVRAAVAAAAAEPLAGPSEPKHLPAWDRLL